MHVHVVGMCSMWRCAGTCACKVQSSSKVDIYTLYNCYNPPLPLPCAVLRAQRGGRGYSYQLAGVKCVSGVRSDFPVFFLAPGKPYRVHVILSTTTQIAFRKKTKTSLTPLRQKFKIISMHLF